MSSADRRRKGLKHSQDEDPNASPATNARIRRSINQTCETAPRGIGQEHEGAMTTCSMDVACRGVARCSRNFFPSHKCNQIRLGPKRLSTTPTNRCKSTPEGCRAETRGPQIPLSQQSNASLNTGLPSRRLTSRTTVRLHLACSSAMRESFPFGPTALFSLLKALSARCVLTTARASSITAYRR